MIARVWRGVVARDRSRAYVDYVDATGVAEYRRAPGCCLSAILTRNLEPDTVPRQPDDTGVVDAGPRVEVIAFSVWVSETDIQAFAGPNIHAMVLYPEDEEYLLEPPTLVHHDVTSLAVSATVLPTTERDF